MRSENAWYWLTAGVLALGLNGAYQDGQFRWMHNLADRTTAMVDRASERGLAVVSMAELMLGKSPESFGRTEAAIQKMQAKIVCDRVTRAQHQMARAQVREQIEEAKLRSKMELAQMKVDRARMIAIDQANRWRNCDGFSKVVVRVPNVPKIDLPDLSDIDLSNVPKLDMDVHVSGNGPI